VIDMHGHDPHDDDGIACLGPVPSEEIATSLATVRARWPQGPEPDATFAALVAAGAAQPRIEDLYLAWWCQRGAVAAIAAFEAAFEDEIRAATARFRELPADELRQHLPDHVEPEAAESLPPLERAAMDRQPLPATGPISWSLGTTTATGPPTTGTFMGREFPQEAWYQPRLAC